MNFIIIGVLSFFIGALIVWIILKAKYETKLSVALKDADSLPKISDELKKTSEELIKAKTQLETMANLQELIKNDFVKLANETIKQEQEDLRKQNQEALELKIAPLTKDIKDFREKVEQFNVNGTKNTTELLAQIKTLEERNKIIEKEAQNLVNALTLNQNVKGAYGEHLLETILQSCGMQEGIHYQRQFVSTAINLNDEQEHKVRPDIVINLPNERHLIIDSKMTLSSYLEYQQDSALINKFKAEVKSRIKDLSNKNYQNAGDLSQPDFVLMYIPVETSVNLIYEDKDLIYDAYKSNIIIVGTSSLLTTVRLVNQLLAQQKQNESVNKIVESGTSLYETFVALCNDLVSLQKKFDGISSQFKTTVNRLKRGKKAIIPQIESLKNYGITSSKEIPLELLQAENSETTEDFEPEEIDIGSELTV